MILLDTHIFVWLNQNDPRLTNHHRQVIEKEREHGLGISTISLIEIARLVSAERIILPLPIQEWFEIALSQEGIILRCKLIVIENCLSRAIAFNINTN
ncbi:MAG: type II toxin-antitoxin system VapC family toxin, partial [Waterburya sp.]